MTTKTEQILEAIKNALLAQGLAVERNSVVPEAVGEEGLVILRDGNPGEPERVLNSSWCYYEHDVEIEVFSQSGAAVVRDGVFDDLLISVDAAMAADKTFGGLSDGVLLSKPDVSTLQVTGGESIKAGTIIARVAYTSITPLG